MRIHIKTTPNKGLIPFNYQPKMVGTIHKWLGINNLHGKPALYSFSWLLKAQPTETGLDYPNGAQFFISFYDDKHMKQVIRTILHDAEMFSGLKVLDITIQEEPDLSKQSLFHCASPILLKYSDGETSKHYTFKDEESGKLLTEKLLFKMEMAGLPEDESLNIRFAPSQGNTKIKLIDYNGIKNKVNQCPVIIEGKPETKAFAWTVGLGNSTGIGFGAIY
ncbi:MAG: CRISPR-associated endoribonuclease Cas6 [Proteiniphilum sp.]|jgi:CRISPR-associated endoribonuclease Cas6|nr:CRISPR-associated endoribonuclease Cas6 [Proteiniphilum sp.]